MNQSKRFVSIGAGNVATHISRNLCKAGYSLIQVYSRTIESAMELAVPEKAVFTTTLAEILPDADFYIVSLSDQIVPSVLNQLNLSGKLIFHTSGSHDLEVFGSKFLQYGVLYPLQTISKNVELNISKVPFLIEGSDSKCLLQIELIAGALSEKVYPTNSETRKWIHLAAVFANNFSNHMLALSQEILDDKDLDFDLLRPLIEETFKKAISMDPKEGQTGPAVRNDTIIMEKHIQMLENKPLLQKIYTFTSSSIQRTKTIRNN